MMYDIDKWRERELGKSVRAVRQDDDDGITIFTYLSLYFISTNSTLLSQKATRGNIVPLNFQYAKSTLKEETR